MPNERTYTNTEKVLDSVGSVPRPDAMPLETYYQVLSELYQGDYSNEMPEQRVSSVDRSGNTSPTDYKVRTFWFNQVGEYLNFMVEDNLVDDPDLLERIQKFTQDYLHTDFTLRPTVATEVEDADQLLHDVLEYIKPRLQEE